MKLLDRYLMRTVLASTGLVLAVLLALTTLMLFLEQQDDIGAGSYDLGAAFLFTALSLPQYAYELLPIAALIGAILGLGALARDSELTVLRASGVSVARIAGAAALAGAVLAGVLWLLGEHLAPPARDYARYQKVFSMNAELDIAGRRSAWVRQGPWFINVRQQSAEGLFGGVFLFRLDRQGRLERVGRADTAAQDPDGGWILTRYAETRLGADRTEVRSGERERTDADFNADFLGLAVTEPRAQPLRSLRAYLAHQRANGLDTRATEIQYWSRWARLAAAVVVCVFAVPFAFGPLRSAGAGARSVFGIVLGILFVLLSQTLENSGKVYQLDPQLVAWGPTALLALVALLAIRRTR
ncbi:MAG: LPS export ABC transporter permease LptG [Gammaproteobacteria bacterium]|nr:LPS export ABC transporter permease LptG [Gammaproteobacteria bacterium]